MDSNLRNIKDFLTLYNKVTELCFTRCVDDLNRRDLNEHENSCVDKCVTKFARFNQKMMSVYVELQVQINQKREKEMEELQKAALANNSEDSSTQILETLPTALNQH